MSSLVGLVESVAAGELPPDSAIAVMANAFGFNEQKAKQILAGAGTTFTKKEDPPLSE